MREMIAEEDAARHRDDRAQHRTEAIERWRSTASGAGNRAFFQLGVELRGAGTALTEIDVILRQEAGYAHHPAERRGQIGSVIRTLAGSPRRLAA